jgi:D-sedoheptulose 7-phosphate isomerase
MTFEKSLLIQILEEHSQTIDEFIRKEGEKILQVVELCAEAFRQGRKLLVFGNGGSAADAQHLAGELVNRFKLERKPLPAIALTTDTSVLTAIANDYDFSLVFVKQIEALGKEGDIALGISTSGNSPNVLLALKRAKELGLTTVGLSGGTGGKMPEVCDILILVPSSNTPRIQEGHLFFLHIFSELLEKVLFT